MRATVRFGRFEFQVRLVLILVVLFLATLDLMNLFLLNQSRDALERSELRAAFERNEGFVEWIGQDRLLNAARAGRGSTNVDNGALRRGAQRRGFVRVALLDLVGATIAESGPALDSGGQSGLTAQDRRELATGRPSGGQLRPARGGPDARMIAFHPLLDRQGRLAGVLETASAVPELGRIVQRLRRLIVVQLIAVGVISVIAIVFANWVSRPYRRLADAAESMGLADVDSGGPADPERLVDTFRGVALKLRKQEEALAGLQGGAGLAGLVRFARSGASKMTTGVLVLDAQRRVVALNPAARILLDRDGADRRLTLADVTGRVPDLDPLVRRCLEHGRGASREVLELVSDEGRAGHLGVALSPATSETGVVEGVLVLVTDLTEIRRLQERTRLRDNMAQVGRLSAGIAHEFRNALGTILGYARRLEKHAETEVVGSAREILREVQSVRGSIDEFLLYARPPEPAEDPVDMETVICACAAAQDNADVRIDGSFGTVVGDEDLLRRAIRNLLRNAVDACGDRERPARIRIRGEVLDGMLRIDVDDDGPGIAEDHLDQVFLPFFTTRARGTGIGLALVQRTVVDLGGTVEAGRSPFGGARFRILLPALGLEREGASAAG